ncbi:hypothetical protein Tco_1151625 [Tanacetum coccineum]
MVVTSDVKTTSTPMETSKHLLKDEDGEEVDVHMYRSMIGSLMYLTSSRLDIMFVVCACARYQVTPKVSHLHAVKRIYGYLKGQPKLGLWYPKDSPFDLVAYTDSDYAGASLDRKSTTEGCQFLGCKLISWQCKKQTMVANSTNEAEYVAASSCCRQAKSHHYFLQSGEGLGHPTNAQHTPSFDISPPQPKKKTQTPRKAKKKITKVPQPSESNVFVADKAIHEERGDSLGRATTTATSLDAEQDINTPGSDEDTIKLKELMETCTKLSKRVLGLEDELKKTKTSQQLKIESLEMRVKRLEKKNRSRTHKLKRMYKIRLTAMVKSSSDEEPAVDEEDTSKQGKSIADIDENEQITLENEYNVDMAHEETVIEVAEDVVEVMEIAKIIVDEVSTASVQDVNTASEEPVSVGPTNNTTAQPSEATEKNVEVTQVIRRREEPAPKKRKEQIQADEELAKKLAAEFDEEQRIEREKAQQRIEANEALINTEKAKLFMEFMKERKKFFARKREEEKRNRPPTKAQQRSIVFTYLKNMNGWKHKQLKNKSFDEI